MGSSFRSPLATGYSPPGHAARGPCTEARPRPDRLDRLFRGPIARAGFGERAGATPGRQGGRRTDLAPTSRSTAASLWNLRRSSGQVRLRGDRHSRQLSRRSIDAEVEDLHHVGLAAGDRDEAVLARRQRLLGPKLGEALLARLGHQLDGVLRIDAVAEGRAAPAPAVVLAHWQVAVLLAGLEPREDPLLCRLRRGEHGLLVRDAVLRAGGRQDHLLARADEGGSRDLLDAVSRAELLLAARSRVGDGRISGRGGGRR